MKHKSVTVLLVQYRCFFLGPVKRKNDANKFSPLSIVVKKTAFILLVGGLILMKIL